MFIVLLVCLAAGVTVAEAQPATTGAATPAAAEARWLPWLGCWQLVEETGALADSAEDPRLFADRVVVCVNQTTDTDPGAAGVEVTTVADRERILVETLVADGRQHPVDGAACAGWRHDTWSEDGARLFTRSELTCENDERRVVSGVGLMASAETWLDIQLLEAGGHGEVTVRRYRRAGASTAVEAGATPLPAETQERARRAAQHVSTTGLGVGDVVEATRALEPATVEAMLVETQASFSLDSRGLIQLDDAGVASEVIDLMVALSFPNEFVVDRPAARTTSLLGGGGGGFANQFDRFNPYGFDRWYPYYASPFGSYYGWSPYSSLYYLGPAASYVITADPELRAGSSGRAYGGRGYTRVEVREPLVERGARRRGQGTNRTGSTQAASSGGQSDDSSSSGQATSDGYSRGGATGRTAQPRR
jgi:hypothetical protein